MSNPKGSQAMYLFNLTWATVLLNLVLFPGLAWLVYRHHAEIAGEIVATEVFFGGLICTLICGITGHLETAKKERGCFACRQRGNCPFLGILILGLGLGTVCVVTSNFYLGNSVVALKTLLWIKTLQGLFLGLVIPQALIRWRLLLHPDVEHGIVCPF